MTENLDDLYRDIIMDHYKYPRGKKRLDEADVTSEGKNPVCGDEIEMMLKLKGDKIDDVSIECLGCAISVASGSMLADTIRGKSISEVKKIAAAIVRIKCALLSWTTLMEGLENWENGKKSSVASTE